MRNFDNYPLQNLSFSKKLIFSAALVLGLLIFGESWRFVLTEVYMNETGTPSATPLGIGLGVVALENPEEFTKLFALHAFSTLLLLVPGYLLFKQSSIRRRARAVLFGIGLVLAFLDVLAWLRAPECSSTNYIVGYLGTISAGPLALLALLPLYQMWVYKRWKNPDGKKKKVFIVGGGFSGLYVALGIDKVLGYNNDLEVVVLDQNNYFLFPPLLPSTAAGTIETRQITFPFRRIFETTNIVFRKVKVTDVDPTAKKIHGITETNLIPLTGEIESKEVEYDYDYIILAPGSATQTFGTKGAEENAYFMRELEDAVVLRNHVIDCFERAAVSESLEQQKELLTFVIVGAGPTGIETATETYDLIHHVLLKRYPEIDPDIPEVYMLQSGDKILPGWNETVVKITNKQLSKIGIKLLLGSRVSEVGSNFVKFGENSEVKTKTVVWCAGVKPSPLLEATGLALHKSGRIEVEKDLSVPGHPEMFVLGDVAFLINEKNDRPLPPLGQVAFQQGSHTAANVLRKLQNKSTKNFKYFDFGGLVSAGEHFAAVDLLGVKLSGFIGWFVWRTLYLVKLPGFGNKVRIVLDWTLDLLIERSISQIREEKISGATITAPLRKAQ